MTDKHGMEGCGELPAADPGHKPHTQGMTGCVHFWPDSMMETLRQPLRQLVQGETNHKLLQTQPPKMH